MLAGDRIVSLDAAPTGFHPDGHSDDGAGAAVTPTGGQGGDTAAEVVVDGAGATLLPGLIDAHVHLQGEQDLRALARAGVTTACDMATWPVELVTSLRQLEHVTDVRSAGTPAIGDAGPHSRMPGFPAEGVVMTPAAAREFVRRRVDEGVDYVKVVVEAPGRGGPGEEAVAALVEAAHGHGRRVVAHAAAYGAVELALAAGADVVTHAPVDRPLDAALVARMVAAGTVSVPTLTMMVGTVRALAQPGADYAHARESVTALHRAGVPIVAGTDANSAPGAPVSVPHGSSLHDELELLVEAGLSPTEALRRATSAAAEAFGLADRGAVEPGRRADQVLVGGDPTSDVSVTRDVRGVWIAGTRTS